MHQGARSNDIDTFSGSDMIFQGSGPPWSSGTQVTCCQTRPSNLGRARIETQSQVLADPEALRYEHPVIQAEYVGFLVAHCVPEDGVVAPLGRLNLGEFGAVTCVLTAALVAHPSLVI